MDLIASMSLTFLSIDLAQSQTHFGSDALFALLRILPSRYGDWVLAQSQPIRNVCIIAIYCTTTKSSIFIIMVTVSVAN